MFDLKKPCNNCPFRVGVGEKFLLGEGYLRSLRYADAFQCHKTVNYEAARGTRERQGKHPQQCAGLMSILSREGTPNTIMQVGERLGYFHPNELDHGEVYASLQDAISAHGGTK